MATWEKSWRCRICGYVHNGEAPPDECPVCGAPASEFEAAEAEKAAAPATDKEPTARKIVIVGAGIAGLSGAEAAREASPEAEITLLSDENEVPYYRLALTRYLAGEIGDADLLIHPASWYAEKRIELRLNAAVTEVRPSEKNVVLENGETAAYDKLVVTAGAQPFVPPIPGADLPHVFTLRTADDAKAILKSVRPGSKVTGIGGGILGLETAGALAKRGASVTVLEAFEHLMPRQLNRTGSEVLCRHLDTLNIEVMMNAQTERITGNSVQLKDGRSVPTDFVIITVGVRSNLRILEQAGLTANRGVWVDHFMRTSDPAILAAGDICEHDGVMYGSWTAAQFQGKIAGMNAAGSTAEFGGIPRSHMLKVLGKDMFSIGTIKADDGSFQVLEELKNGNYRMFMLRGGQLEGCLLLGSLELMPAAARAVQERTEMPQFRSAAEAADYLAAR